MAAATAAAETKEVSVFSLTEAHALAFRVAHVPCRFRPDKKWPWWKRFGGLSLVQFILLHLDLALQWQASLPVALLVLVERQKKGKQKVLLFDGRLWAEAAGRKPEPLCWLISRSSEKLMRQYDDASQFPKLSFLSSPPPPPPTERQSLRELLGLAGDISFSDPQNLFDLRQCLSTHCSGNGGWDALDGGVTVVQGEDRDVCFFTGRQFVVEAKTDENCRIFYQDLVCQPVQPLRSPAASSPEEEEDGGGGGGSDGLDDGEDGRMTDVLRANRSAATSVCHSGLNLAFSLGVISLEEFHSLSFELGKTAASLALHLDDRGHLRHIFYRDAESSFGQEVTCFEEKSENKKEDECREKAVQNVNAFWNHVWNRREIWGVPARAQILRDVLVRLERLTVLSHSSPFDKCLRDLKRCIHLQRLVFFSSQEDQIHSIKFYLAHYVCKVIRNQRGLQLKTSSDNNIYALVAGGQVSIFNLQAYVNVKEDAEFFDQNGWIPPPVILHSKRNLHHQPTLSAASGKTKTIGSVVTLRARMVAFAQLEFWTKFGRDSISFFGVDLHGNGQAFRSASLLAFESVWTRYIRLGGPLVQGLEKMKPHYAKMLRSASRGGFAFSARKFLDAASSSDSKGGRHRSIMEFDLSSAYGYSASNALMPSGFCTGFFLLKEDEEEEKEKKEEEEKEDVAGSSSSSLIKTDVVRRHQTFEFKAVYFTLRKLMLSSLTVAAAAAAADPRNARPRRVRTVFSNFSPSGLFHLDRYPADLTVIFDNGQIEVYQFDGHFVHGCDVCASSTTTRWRKFAHGQTHEQVRTKTLQRDKIFQEWVASLNSAAATTTTAATASVVAKYVVISDCHSPGYSLWSLDQAFRTDPVLAQLVAPYETVCGGLERRSRHGRKRKREEGFCRPAAGEVTLESWLNFMKREEENDSFTCIAWVKGFCSPPPPSLVAADNNPAAQGCLISHSSSGCTLSTCALAEPVVLIRDYFRYLVSSQGFVVTDLEAVLFFKTEPIFNQIFRELIERRRSSQDFKEKNWIKRLVNLSCGFFGFRETGGSRSGGFRRFSIRSRIPRTFNISSHQIVDIHRGAVCLDGTQYYIMSCSQGCRPRKGKGQRRKGPFNNALALFFTVIEMGKLRLVQALQFFSRHLPPASWSLLYSNVDNIIIALEGAGSLDEAVFLAGGNDGLTRYLAEKPIYLADSSQTVEPGQLKLEWLCNSPTWRFITAGIMHYVLRDNGNHDDDDDDDDNDVDDDDKKNDVAATTAAAASRPGRLQRQKTAGLSKLSNKQAFRYALSLMFGKQSSVVIPQDRCISKLHSTATVRQNMEFRRRSNADPSDPPHQ